MEMADGGDLNGKIEKAKKQKQHVEEEEIWDVLKQMV